MSGFGYPFEARVSLICFNSLYLLSSVVGRLRDLLMRVVAVLFCVSDRDVKRSQGSGLYAWVCD